MKNKRVYMDHAAATPCDERVVKAMSPYWSRVYANPSAIHAEGVMAKRILEDARKRTARALRVRPHEIIFTGGATESANLALRGAILAFRKVSKEKPHIIVSAIEHPAVLEAARALEQEGARLTVISTNERGRIDPQAIAAALSKETAIVSIGLANSEIGVVQPLSDIAREVAKFRRTRESSWPLLHTDAVQAPNYLDVGAERLGVDLMTLSGGKIYGPKGVAILYKKRTVPLEPIVYGGGQEDGFRSGTEAVALATGFAAALEIALGLREKESKRLSLLRDALIAGLEAIPGVELNGDRKHRLPNNVNISIEGIDNEFFVLKLDREGIAASTKSACAEGGAASHVILALGKSRAKAESSIRLTLGRATSKSEIARALSTIKRLLIS